MDKRETDLRYFSTSVGPHRDDFGIFINDKDVRIYGSQGQQRTSAISIKLTEIDMLKQLKNDEPILLLDDVMSNWMEIEEMLYFPEYPIFKQL